MSLFLGGLAIFFAIAFASITPVYRRAVRMLRRYKTEVRKAQAATEAAIKAGVTRALELEASLVQQEQTVRTQVEALKLRDEKIAKRDQAIEGWQKESARNKEIRSRTENGLVIANHRLDVLRAELAKTEAENASLKRVMQHVQVIE